jgi:uncharacterized protein YjaG (DUF416 family)
MPTIHEKGAILAAKLSMLPPKLRIVFAVNCAEVAFPRYRDWVESEGRGWAKPEVLQSVLSQLWDAVEMDQVPSVEWEHVVNEVMEVVPDTEDFPEASSVGALDAGCAVAEAVECAIRGEAEAAALAGESALFAADNILGTGARYQTMTQAQLREEPARELEGERREWERQLRVLEVLSEWHDAPMSRASFRP